MILGIGVDILEIGRLYPMRPAFLRKAYTPDEQSYIADDPRTAAGLFAAKEAVAKAMGCGFSGFWPRDIEILHTNAGAPIVRLHGAARQAAAKIAAKTRKPARRARSRHAFHVNISHSSGTAVAVAIFCAVAR